MSARLLLVDRSLVINEASDRMPLVLRSRLDWIGLCIEVALFGVGEGVEVLLGGLDLG